MRRAPSCFAALALAVHALSSACSTPAAASDAATTDASDATAPDAWAPPPIVVTTASGPVQGRPSDGSIAFLGIPYAAPPVGALRFRPPAPPASWSTPRPSERPSACPQDLQGLLTIGDEDCLYLNVHTPDPMPARAPVMVWIHGGAFVLGEGLQTDGGTAGDVLARDHGVIVVSMNYRLGQLGFLAHPALDAESADHVSGNYGFLDQVAALEWVRANIAAFGGDPSNVTLFGESAGGMSVCGHLTSARSRGLYQRAIIESGPCGLPMNDLAAAEAQGARLGEMLGCTSGDVAACLRAVPARTMIETLGASPAIVSTDPTYGRWGPIVDGTVFGASWLDAMRAGDAADVPVVVGWNHDEGRLFVALAERAGSPPITVANYRASVAALVGEANADAVIARYPVADYGGDARWAASAAMGDAGLICPTRAAAIALRDAGRLVHAYLFSYPDARFLLPASFPLGAFHSAEIQFVFGHPVGGPFDADAMALSEAMGGYWTRFAAHDADPNDAASPTWPPFDASGSRVVLDRTITTDRDDMEATCAFWDTIPLSL